MALSIVPFAAEHVPAVKALNARLKVGGSPYTFPEDPVPAWLPAGSRPYQEYRVALDDDDVRGAYILKHERFTLAGAETDLGCFQLPLSEGIIDRRYAPVAIRLLRDALGTYGKLYTLGMGSLEEPVARLLAGAGWNIAPVPFYYRVIRGKNFLRELKYARSSAWRRLAMDAMAYSGLGSLGIRAFQAYKTKSAPSSGAVTVESFDAFDVWSDTIWSHNVSRLRCAAVRTARVLNRLYAAEPGRFMHLRLLDGATVRGWVVLLATQHERHRHFGAMKLGSIVDGLCDPGYERELLQVATAALEHAGVDLIVTNQSWRVFGDALASLGYLRAATNFFFAASPELTAVLDPLEASLADAHITRGDGDGPINL